MRVQRYPSPRALNADICRRSLAFGCDEVEAIVPDLSVVSNSVPITFFWVNRAIACPGVGVLPNDLDIVHDLDMVNVEWFPAN